MKNQKGITLISLTVTIAVLIILTFTVVVNVEQYGNQKIKTNFNIDIKSLNEEIRQYYAREKSLPVINKFTNTSMIENIKNVNDNDNYYVIDISKLDVDLKYGKDYDVIKEKSIDEEITDLLDVYIINEQSHTIYYPKGIEFDGKVQYGIDKSYNMIKVEGYVNKPKLLEGMTPIKFTMPTNTEMGKTEVTTEDDEEWYEYGTTPATRRWANAQTKDGSMWVWIPRYAYKITGTTIDVVFLIGTTDNYYDENGAIKTAQRQKEVDQTIDTTKDYTVHPAFTDESDINFANGGWDEELTGIWVAKFEAGYASGNNDAEVVASNVYYTQTTSHVHATESMTESDSTLSARNWLDGIYGETKTTIKYPVFMPLTYSMNYINHNDSYNLVKALTDSGNIYGLSNKNADSHLMKNSEWGAVAYLSQSIYGQNGIEIKVNNATLNSGNQERISEEGKTGVDSAYAVTGCTSNSTNQKEIITTISDINSVSGNIANINGIYVWNQLTGQNASTTGTIYGIYDMSGGLWEKTTSYIVNGSEN